MRPARLGPLVGPLGLILFLAVAVGGAAAREHRPTPFGDDLVSRPVHLVSADALRRGGDHSVLAYDRRSGRAAWSYRRPGRIPLRLVAAAGTTVAVWDDGMLTGMRPDQPAVRWHRFVPGVGGGIRLVPLEDGAALLVLTPELVVTYTTSDGAIRTDSLPPPGCGYAPGRVLVTGGLVVVARPCAVHSTVEAFDGEGRRWQRATGRFADPVPGGPGTVGVAEPPLLRPLLLDRRTGLPPVDWAS